MDIVPQKKNRRDYRRFEIALRPGLSVGADAVGRADFCAGAAACARIGINETGISLFADCFDRALGFTCAAVDAVVLIDEISHELPPVE